MGTKRRVVSLLVFAAAWFFVAGEHGGAALAARPAKGARPRANGRKVAVQPFDGSDTESLRNQIVRIMRGRGFHPMTTLPRYEGTGQYPGLARDHHLTAFVTADVEDRKGRGQRVTFLVWNGLSGSIVGRWTVAASVAELPRAVDRGFWSHMGPALSKAQAPALPPELNRAPPMRIDASDGMDRPIATR